MIYEVEDYGIEVGQDRTGKEVVYQLVNKATGVVEFEDYLLPRMIEMMIHVQDQLKESRESLRKAAHVSLQLVDTEDNNGGAGGLH